MVAPTSKHSNHPHPTLAISTPRLLTIVNVHTEALGALGAQHAHRPWVRELHAERCVLRSEDKSLIMQPQAERLGYALDGLERWVAPPCAKMLDTIALGLELLAEGEVPLLPLKIFGGRMGHGLQLNRLLWCSLSLCLLPGR